MELLNQNEFEEINDTIRNRYPKLEVETAAIAEIKPLLLNDKKNVNGEISFTLLNKIGSAIYNQKVNDALISEAFEFILNPEA